ncbi:MAG TPA: cobalamin biosynthesis protein CbiM [Candidatus Omnitrophica bacterium]|nr:cobalamin biosynthesis protein CbiM [Candidatus Omnitrophota bacterium]
MHIPDGFLTASTSLAAWLISAASLGVCLRRATNALKDRMVPLMGVMATFIFVAQMLNFPVIAGTSGHLLGAVLAVVLLGPYAGSLVIAIVLIAQCFILQDGGLLALGANMLNMAFIGGFGGYAVYRFVSRIAGKSRTAFSAAAAGWFSIIFSSAAVSFELAFSGTSPLRVVLPAMLSVHVFVGIGEAVLTFFIIGFMAKVRPDLIYNSSVPLRGTK